MSVASARYDIRIQVDTRERLYKFKFILTFTTNSKSLDPITNI